MLTGRPPLKGSTLEETLRLVQEEDPVPPSRLRSKLPFDLETICLKCVSRDPRGAIRMHSVWRKTWIDSGRRIDPRSPDARMGAGSSQRGSGQ